MGVSALLLCWVFLCLAVSDQASYASAILALLGGTGHLGSHYKVPKYCLSELRPSLEDLAHELLTTY